MSETDLTSLRLEEIYHQKRRTSFVFKWALYLSVPVISFIATLLVLQKMDEADQLKRDELTHALTEATQTVNGLMVYSPSNKAKSDHPPSLAFNGSHDPGSFWEAGTFPIDLIVILPEQRTLTTYSMSAREFAGRMPKSWSVESSVDGKAWHTVDRQENAPPWHANETRSYQFSRPDPVKVLRFEFLQGFDPAILRIYDIAFAP
jgi:hypothetical protein